MKVTLKRCPFCGGDATIGFDEPQHIIECTKCGAGFISLTSPARCVVGWNNRTAAGLVNWIEGEVEKCYDSSDKRYRALSEFREQVNHFLGQ